MDGVSVIRGLNRVSISPLIWSIFFYISKLRGGARPWALIWVEVRLVHGLEN
jgi:hypothetical protein